MAPTRSIVTHPIPPAPPSVAPPLVLFRQSAVSTATLMIDKMGPKLTPAKREAAIRSKARDLKLARQRVRPPLRDALQSELVRKARRDHHDYYVQNIVPHQRPLLRSSDFPATKPSGSTYSDKSYQRFLMVMTDMPIPAQSATQEELETGGFPSWKAFVVAAALRHWRPRIGVIQIRRHISYMPGCAPTSPPRCLPRRSYRLQRKSMSAEERYWSD